MEKCLICGASLHRFNQVHFHAKYCSDNCRQKAYRQRMKVVTVKPCDYCQQEHTRKGRYCSDACKQAAYRARK